MENRPKIKISRKNTLSDEFLVYPKPIYNRNMAKVYIVKRSQNWIFVDRIHFVGPTPDFKTALKTAIF